MNIPHGLVWLHVSGPDGHVVLLGKYDSYTNLVCLIDDGCTDWPLEDGNRIHKWTVYHVEEVQRPAPAPSFGWIYRGPKTLEVHVNDEGHWCETESGEPVGDLMAIFDRKERHLSRVVLTTT